VIPAELTPAEREAYAWQMDLAGLGEAGQRRLKGATVLVSRCGGLGGPCAQQLAAMGVGRLIILHGGVVLPTDIHRQILQDALDIGRPRLPGIIRRLRALQPGIDIVGVDANADPALAATWVPRADAIVDAAPLFAERFALNDAAVAARVPLIEAAVHGWDGTLTTVLPGRSPCLRCFCPEAPPTWTRRFPVLGAVSATIGSLAALEVVQILTGCGPTLAGHLLSFDARTASFRRLRLARDPACAACGGLTGPG
jgi:molybdopterin-synthase adenylyltransferase